MFVPVKNLIKLLVPPILIKIIKAVLTFSLPPKKKPSNQAALTDKIIKIGIKEIVIPGDHMLGVYLALYPRHDQALGEITRIMYEHMGTFSAIDIGANVGDTAALICKYHNIPVLCIEGCSKFIPYLKTNAAKMGHHIHIAECFVGIKSGFIDKEFINISKGTAVITNLSKEEHSKVSTLHSIKTLEDILAQNNNFEGAALIKIDTDGCDFEIINHSLNCLKKNRPVLFFEYDPSFKLTGEDDAQAAMQSLWDIGYRNFLIYDNFGNFFIALHDLNGFHDLNAYLAANRKTNQIIYYFDVCAISNEQLDLFEKIRNHELHYSKTTKPNNKTNADSNSR
jgi:FkbM family methyltransferase